MTRSVIPGRASARTRDHEIVTGLELRIPGSALRTARNDGFVERLSSHPMTTLFTILFDGVAYGMLLFVLACGLAVTLGLMNFVNLAHGAFAMTGGYICAVLVNNSGWPFFAALPLAFVVERRDRRGAGAHALPPSLHPQPSRPGAVHDRPHLHVGGGGRLHHGIVAHLHQAAGGARGPVRFLRRRHRPLPADDHRDLRPAHGGAAIDPGENPVRQPPCARRSTIPAPPAASASTCRRCLPSPLPSVAALQGSAARSAPKFSGSIRIFR